MRYGLVIFDWDGTLVDSIDRIITCYRRSLEQFGYPYPGDQCIKETIGLPLVESYQHMIDGPLDDAENERLVEAYRQWWWHPDIPETDLFPGVRNLLDALQDRAVLAIATGKSRKGMERETQRHNIRDRFAHTRCAGETRAKPDPEMLQQILEEARMTPEQTIMIGDHVLDLEMAVAAGIDAVGITTGSVDRARLQACGPVAVVDAIEEFHAYLSL